MVAPGKQGWVKCASGELERLEHRLWYRRIKQLVVTTVAAVAASSAVALAAWEVTSVFASDPASPSFVRPAAGCTRVIPCAEDVNDATK